MKILISHPTAHQGTRNAILAFKKKNMLFGFTTSINFDTKKFPLNILPKTIKNFLNKRNFNHITTKIYSTSAFLEFFQRALFKIFNKDYVNFLYEKNDIFTSKILFKNKQKINAVYASEGSALETFIMAKRYNIKCIYELPTTYWKAKSFFLNNETIEPKYKLLNLDQELKLADLIIVPTQFVKKTLKNTPINNKKIIILPYGFNKINKTKRQWFDGKRKLNLLYVGSLIERKGIKYLIRSIKELMKIHKNMISATIIGSGSLKNYAHKELPEAKFIENLSYNNLLKHYRTNDIFILPSLLEGFGLVITEAMSNGMVVMSTNRTGLPEIRNDNDSILIKANNAKDIVHKVTYLIKRPKQIERMGKNALITASKYSWPKYQNKLVEIINDNL